jgi:hypothetical protein
MENILLLVLFPTFIVFLIYLLNQIKVALELTNIYKDWLTPKIILIKEGCNPTVRRTETHYGPKTTELSKAYTTLVPTDTKLG